MMQRLHAISYITLLSISLRGSELPQNVRKILAQHTGELHQLLQEQGVTRKDWLPGYLVKYGIERVPNAQKLRKTIQKHNLNLLDVPRKYIYQVYDKDKAPNNQNSIVVAEYIQGTPGIETTLNLQQTQQLYCAVDHTALYDLNYRNYIVANNQTVYIIDTDSIAMPPLYEIGIHKIVWLLSGYEASTIHFKVLLCTNEILHTYNKDAEAWLRKTLERRGSQRKMALGVALVVLCAGITAYQYTSQQS
jgi:hypothetical protein